MGDLTVKLYECEYKWVDGTKIMKSFVTVLPDDVSDADLEAIENAPFDSDCVYSLFESEGLGVIEDSEMRIVVGDYVRSYKYCPDTGNWFELD